MKTIYGVLAQPKHPAVWLKRIGMGGFLFFLIKGLLWLALPALLAVAGIS